MIWNLDFREKRGQRMHDKIGEYVHPWWRLVLLPNVHVV